MSLTQNYTGSASYLSDHHVGPHLLLVAVECYVGGLEYAVHVGLRRHLNSMALAVTIRIATPGDAPALARLLEAFDGPGVSPEQARRRLLAVQGLETVFLAEVAGEAVGFASVRVIPYISDDTPYAELTELYVAPDYRRQGIGRALMSYVEALAEERGATEILLLTGTRNEPAQAFYRAIGYGNYALAMRKRCRKSKTREGMPDAVPDI